MTHGLTRFATAPDLLRCLTVDPEVYLRVQYIERQRTVGQHFIVEGADVELIAKLLFCLIPQFENLQLSQFISQGLSGPRDVTVDFALEFGSSMAV
jgi:hypothetical protein